MVSDAAVANIDNAAAIARLAAYSRVHTTDVDEAAEAIGRIFCPHALDPLEHSWPDFHALHNCAGFDGLSVNYVVGHAAPQTASLVFGGAMHADQDDHHPWLREEDLFLQRLLDLHMPVLGICLGAQLLGSRILRRHRPPAFDREQRRLSRLPLAFQKFGNAKV